MYFYIQLQESLPPHPIPLASLLRRVAEMRVRWSPDAVSKSRVLQFTVIWGADPKGVICYACCVHFGTLGDHWVIQKHLGAQEGIPWGPGLNFCWLAVDSGTAHLQLLVNFGTTNIWFFSSFFPGHVFEWVRGLNVDVWGLNKSRI